MTEKSKQLVFRMTPDRKKEVAQALLDAGISFQKWVEQEMEKFIEEMKKKKDAR